MPSLDCSLLDLTGLDLRACGDSPLHRLDPRAKMVATLAYLVTVTSFPPPEVAGLIPFIVFPVIPASAASLPAGFLLTRIAAVLPFAAAVAVFNPAFDRETAVTIGGCAI